MIKRIALILLVISFALAAAAAWRHETHYGPADILKAIDDRNAVKVRNILLRQPDLAKVRDKEGLSALFWAVRSGDVDMTRFIISHGADPNQAGRTGQRPIHVLALADENDTTITLATLLIDRKADVSARSVAGYTPLHAAAQNGRARLAKLLVAHGANVNEVTEHGDTPLHLAAQQASIETIRLLIDHGAKVNALNVEGRTPLYYAEGHHRGSWGGSQDHQNRQSHQDHQNYLDRQRQVAAYFHGHGSGRYADIQRRREEACALLRQYGAR